MSLSQLARSLAALLAAAVLPFVPAHAATPDLSTLESAARWIKHYYEAPQPKLASQAILVLSKGGVYQNDGETPPTFGFVAGVLAKNKAIAPSLIKDLTELPGDERKILVLGIWYSGRPDAKKLLQGLLSAMPEHKVNIENLLNSQPISLRQISLDQGTWVVDALWGNFCATGDAEPVKRVITALPWATLREDPAKLAVGEVARWSLTTNAVEHPRVLEICRKEVAKQPPEIAKLLKEVIAEAEQHRTKPAAP